MTAICGLWHQDGLPDAGHGVTAMRRALAPYGTFRSAMWDGGDIALGIQLARLLPEDRFDRQPLTDRAERFRLVGDLRIDNRAELAAALGVADWERRADADLVLAAWERWGPGALDRLCGDFAIVVWDAARRCLHLARDMIGYRPLFFHATPRRFAFATMARGLHALPDIARAADPITLRNHLALLPMRGSRSFFLDIERVEPGQRIVVHADGRIERHDWYDWNASPDARRSDADHVEALRAAFDRAVADRLRNVGTIGSQLSGGLDSTLVTATAASHLASTGKRLSAYTHVPLAGVMLDRPAGRSPDEWALAARLADGHANIDHYRVEAPDRLIGDDLDSHFHTHEYPAFNLCNQVWLSEIGRQMRDRGETMLLVGMLGNMTVSRTGLERLSVLARSGHWLQLAKEVRGLHKGGRSLNQIARLIGGQVLPNRLLDRLRHLGGGSPWRLEDYSALRQDIIESDAFRANMAAIGHDPRFPAPRDTRTHVVTELRRLDLLGLMHKGQLALYGVDQRDPTADRRVIESSLALPADLLMRDGRTHWIYHAAFADRIPREILTQRGKGLQAADWPERLARSRGVLADELRWAEPVAQVGALMDLKALAQRNAIPSVGPTDEKQRRERRLKLLRAVSVAHFIRKASGQNY